MFTTKSGRELTYFGREYTADIRRADGKQHIIATVDDLFELLLKVWCRDTAYPSCQKDYIQENDPTYGQCAISAMLVYDMFGGRFTELGFLVAAHIILIRSTVIILI